MFLPYFKEKENCVIFFLFRLWSTPDLPHREIQLSLDCHRLSIRQRGNLSLKKKINERVTDIDVVNEYRNLFLPLLSVYASVFNEAGVPFWKLHISVKLKFQLLTWLIMTIRKRRSLICRSSNGKVSLVIVLSTCQLIRSPLYNPHQ